MDFMMPIRAIVPMVLLVSLGIFLRKVKMIDDETRLSVNKIIFKVFLPAMIFNNLYNSDMNQVFNGPVIIYTAVSTILIFIILAVVMPLFVKDSPKCSVLIQGLFRSNTVFLGVPFVIELSGAENAGLVTLLVALIVPIYNIQAVICFEMFRKGKPNFKHTILNIVKNPLIIASVAGILVKAAGLSLPDIFEKFISETAKIATPLALILLGAFLNFKAAKEQIKYLLIGVTGRLVLIPAVFLSGAVLLGFRGIELISLIAIVCMPAAVSSFTMAEQMGGDVDLSANLVIFSTAISPITIVMWIYLMQWLGFL
ncbi:MAG: AEC family transporter [Eubacteriales bacterium]|nr:AEC family transporter [Eubacteriales bacterium]